MRRLRLKMPNQRKRGPGEGRIGRAIPLGRDFRGQGLDGAMARYGNPGRRFGHLHLDTVEQPRRAEVFERLVALAHGAVERRRRAGVGGVEA